MTTGCTWETSSIDVEVNPTRPQQATTSQERPVPVDPVRRNSGPVPVLREETSLKKRKRKPPPVVTKLRKKRAAVVRTHSPRVVSTVVSIQPNVHMVTPTLQGIHEVARHLQKSQATDRRSQSLLALPTECSYELCSLVSWKKRETLSEAEVAFRASQLEQCKLL